MMTTGKNIVRFLVPAVGVACPMLLKAEDPAVANAMSLAQIIETGGWMMYVLGGMSILGVALVIYFFIILRQSEVVPREFLRDMLQMLSAGRLDEARTACAKNRSALSSVISVALDYADRSHEVDASLLKEMMEGEGSRQSASFQNQIQYLLDIAVISPMLGLLGTVMGMLTAFNAVALDIAKAKPMVLASGVSQALITTAAGLMVGIPAMMFYAYFRGRTSRLVTGMEAASADVLALLSQKSTDSE